MERESDNPADITETLPTRGGLYLETMMTEIRKQLRTFLQSKEAPFEDHLTPEERTFFEDRTIIAGGHTYRDQCFIVRY